MNMEVVWESSSLQKSKTSQSIPTSTLIKDQFVWQISSPLLFPNLLLKYARSEKLKEPIKRVLSFQKIDELLGLSLVKESSLCPVGAGHGDELFSLFDTSGAVPFDSRAREEDLKMSKLIVELWTDFATNFDPTPKTKQWER